MRRAVCPYTDRFADSAEYFSKSNKYSAAPCADSVAFFERNARNFSLRSIFCSAGARKIIVNKFANVADSAR